MQRIDEFGPTIGTQILTNGKILYVSIDERLGYSGCLLVVHVVEQQKIGVMIDVRYYVRFGPISINGPTRSVDTNCPKVVALGIWPKGAWALRGGALFFWQISQD